ncbi:hypothetical protein FQN57_001457 [Myotisia sp. PD_48]|nr:hypothetical protein FQN57_001457 [Myotisia sp. PD_48]
MPESSANISTRVSLRWPPEPAFEYTDTTSLSVGGWYVDLRINKQTGGLDWAMAGQRIVESEDPPIVSFTHLIDSLQSFDTTDQGTFKTLPNGDDFESGKMPRPDLPGAPLRDYEEIWRKIPLPQTVGNKLGYSWILESQDSIQCHGAKLALDWLQDTEEDDVEEVQNVKTFLGRVPGHFIALRQCLRYKRDGLGGKWVVKTGGEVSARREEWDALSAKDARVKYLVGKEAKELPSLITGGELVGFAGEGEEGWNELGEVVRIGDEKYVLRAFEVR